MMWLLLVTTSRLKAIGLLAPPWAPLSLNSNSQMRPLEPWQLPVQRSSLTQPLHSCNLRASREHRILLFIWSLLPPQCPQEAILGRKKRGGCKIWMTSHLPKETESFQRGCYIGPDLNFE